MSREAQEQEEALQLAQRIAAIIDNQTEKDEVIEGVLGKMLEQDNNDGVLAFNRERAVLFAKYANAWKERICQPQTAQDNEDSDEEDEEDDDEESELGSRLSKVARTANFDWLTGKDVDDDSSNLSIPEVKNEMEDGEPIEL